MGRPNIAIVRGREAILARWYEEVRCHDCISPANWIVFELPGNGISYPNPIRWFWCGKCS